MPATSATGRSRSRQRKGIRSSSRVPVAGWPSSKSFGGGKWDASLSHDGVLVDKMDPHRRPSPSLACRTVLTSANTSSSDPRLRKLVSICRRRPAAPAPGGHDYRSLRHTRSRRSRGCPPYPCEDREGRALVRRSKHATSRTSRDDRHGPSGIPHRLGLPSRTESSNPTCRRPTAAPTHIDHQYCPARDELVRPSARAPGLLRPQKLPAKSPTKSSSREPRREAEASTTRFFVRLLRSFF